MGKYPSPAQLEESRERGFARLVLLDAQLHAQRKAERENTKVRVVIWPLRGRRGENPRPPASCQASLATRRSGAPSGFALQIQCYQCEEFQLNNDCSSPEFIVNCTVNVQDMCQKEVMEQSAGIMYRKSCASSAACLIASAGYQSFCSPGKLNSVCISCCNTPLCNGPRPKKRSSSASSLQPQLLLTFLLLTSALFLAHC
ncbi:ly6/PLAUR domain-containing protein 1 isoform X1 [Sorex araneus]|uniref:ly6/PLAUR domain-containing protein 1 isoform X1 n=1 Tax=Sorex araneus TaxID=42254 RepID=UPI002433E182|nr:ly6/PLAUR domain-containing protein 1 isoform X1 [Sorex araneus]